MLKKHNLGPAAECAFVTKSKNFETKSLKNFEAYLIKISREILRRFWPKFLGCSRNDIRQQAQNGYAALAVTLITIGVSLLILGGLSFFALEEVNINRNFIKAVESRTAAESGLEDAVYRFISGKQLSSSETFGTGTGTSTILVTQNGSTRIIRSQGTQKNSQKNFETRIDVTTQGANFFYGVQVDQGGVEMDNGAHINGNVFSNGSIEGGTVTGNATVATGYQMKNLAVGGAARAPSFTNVTAGGSACPNANCVVANDPPQSLPLSDATIQSFRDNAASGGSAGSQTISGSASLGPKKINGDLTVKGGATLTITGTLWITGNFSISNGAIVKLNVSYGANSGVVVVDDTVGVSNNASVSGSGQVGSYLMIVAAKNALSSDIIDVGNNSAGAIYYAPHGRVHFNNNAGAKEVTAYGLDLDNNATVTYESGLSDVHFTSGPSGGYEIKYWREVE